MHELNQSKWATVGEDKNLKPVIANAKCKIVNYLEVKLPSELNLQVPGKHNIKNIMNNASLLFSLKLNLM